jgi:hypothetical protein
VPPATAGRDVTRYPVAYFQRADVACVAGVLGRLDVLGMLGMLEMMVIAVSRPMTAMPVAEAMIAGRRLMPGP